MSIARPVKLIAPVKICPLIVVGVKISVSGNEASGSSGTHIPASSSAAAIATANRCSPESLLGVAGVISIWVNTIGDHIGRAKTGAKIHKMDARNVVIKIRRLERIRQRIGKGMVLYQGPGDVTTAITIGVLSVQGHNVTQEDLNVGILAVNDIY